METIITGEILMHIRLFSLWTHLNEGILFCGKFNVVTVQGISVVLAALENIAEIS